MKASRRVFRECACVVVLLFPAVSGAADLSVGASVWYAWYNENQINKSDPSVDPTFTVHVHPASPPVEPHRGVPVRCVRLPDVAGRNIAAAAVRLGYRAQLFHQPLYKSVRRREGDGVFVRHRIPMEWVRPSVWVLRYRSRTVCSFSATYRACTVSGREEHDGGRPRTHGNSDSMTLSLAYYIESASTTITLGGRYQWFNIDYEKDDPDEFPESNITFYGLTFSAVYSFEL